MLIPLTDLDEGESGKVVEIAGGRGVYQKLDAMRITIGVRVKKMSSLMLRGPVVIVVGNTQVAIGRGMANKVMVEVK